MKIQYGKIHLEIEVRIVDDGVVCITDYKRDVGEEHLRRIEVT